MKTKTHFLLLLFCTLFLCSSIDVLAVGDKSEENKEKKIDILFNQRIPMRDGVNLSSIVWKPENQDKALPVIFVMTPYISDGGHKRAEKFAKSGYVYVIVDRRGRGNSEGEFKPLEDSGTDGFDVIEWLVKQPWCNGKVAMRGGSYRGMVQWKIMAQHHKNLVTTVPTASVYPGHDFPKRKNIFMGYMANWLTYTNGKTGNRKLFGDKEFWSYQFEKIEREGLPFKSLGLLPITNTKSFERWISHPTDDEYWRGLNPASADYSKIGIPILTITGHFDSDQQGALRYYREHMENASSKAKDNHYLVIGPWQHGGTRKPVKELEGLTFGDNSVLDMDQLQIDWFDWIIKDGEKPDILKDKVNFYVMGEDKWCHVSNLEAMSDNFQKLYLSSPQSDASDIFHSGILSDSTPNAQKPDSFVSNPLEINSSQKFTSFEYGGYVSQHDGTRENVLIYHSAPLTEELTISGQIQFTAAISMDVADTDLSVKLFAIMPDGMSYFIGEDMMRARYRNSLQTESLVKTGTVESYMFDGFDITSRKLPQRTRLRIIIGTLESNRYWQGWQKNYNNGGSVSLATKNDAQTATIKIHMDNGQSFLKLPLLK